MTRKGDPAKRTAKQIRQINRAKRDKLNRQIKHLEAKVGRIQLILQRLKSEAKAFDVNKATVVVSIMDKKREYNKDHPTLLLQDPQEVVCNEVLALIERLNPQVVVCNEVQSNTGCECIVKE